MFAHKKRAIIIALISLIILFFLPFLGFYFLTWTTKNSNSTSVVLVLGAGIRNNQYPSKVLENRLETAIDLYNQQKISTFLVSGDNSSIYYNEPEVMQKYLINRGIPKESIVADFAGRRTLDSCWRAKNVFKVEQILIVSQDFHLPRAEYLCKSVGLKTFSKGAPDSSWQVELNGYIREVPAAWVALWETINKYEAEIKADGSEPNLNNSSN